MNFRHTTDYPFVEIIILLKKWRTKSERYCTISFRPMISRSMRNARLVKIRGVRGRNRKPPIPCMNIRISQLFHNILSIKPIYKELSTDNLLSRCIGGFTQNESFNEMVWSVAPKSVSDPNGKVILNIAATIAVVSIMMVYQA